METLTVLQAYEDDRGNRVEYPADAQHSGTVSILFRGRNNVLRVAPRARLTRLQVVFDCDDGEMSVGSGSGSFAVNARVGQDSRILIGDRVTSTAVVGMSATEGTTITVGEDVMFATNNQVRADDGHPIFDVRTNKRVNVSRDISIGPHVWLGWGACVLGGSVVGEGSVLGMGTILKGRIPNNVVAAGAPARVIRADIAWERPHLSLTKPYYKPDASTVKKSKYWSTTRSGDVPAPPPRPSTPTGPPRPRSFPRRALSSIRRRMGRWLRAARRA